MAARIVVTTVVDRFVYTKWVYVSITSSQITLMIWIDVVLVLEKAVDPFTCHFWTALALSTNFLTVAMRIALIDTMRTGALPATMVMYIECCEINVMYTYPGHMNTYSCVVHSHVYTTVE